MAKNNREKDLIEVERQDLPVSNIAVKDVRFSEEYYTSNKTSSNIQIIYSLKDKLVHTCSMCRKKKEIEVIEGKRISKKILEDAVDKNAKVRTIPNDTFYLLCKSCAVIRKI